MNDPLGWMATFSNWNLSSTDAEGEHDKRVPCETSSMLLPVGPTENVMEPTSAPE